MKKPKRTSVGGRRRQETLTDRLPWIVVTLVVVGGGTIFVLA